MNELLRQSRKDRPAAKKAPQTQAKKRPRDADRTGIDNGQTGNRKAIERWEDEGGPPPPPEKEKSG